MASKNLPLHVARDRLFVNMNWQEPSEEQEAPAFFKRRTGFADKT